MQGKLPAARQEPAPWGGFERRWAGRAEAADVLVAATCLNQLDLSAQQPGAHTRLFYLWITLSIINAHGLGVAGGGCGRIKTLQTKTARYPRVAGLRQSHSPHGRRRRPCTAASPRTCWRRTAEEQYRMASVAAGRRHSGWSRPSSSGCRRSGPARGCMDRDNGNQLGSSAKCNGGWTGDVLAMCPSTFGWLTVKTFDEW